MSLRIIGALASVTLLLSVVIAGCGGTSAIGEECYKVGETDVCDEGGVCGKNQQGVIVCQKICKDKPECGAGEDCRGVEGTSLKGCRQM